MLLQLLAAALSVLGSWALCGSLVARRETDGHVQRAVHAGYICLYGCHKELRKGTSVLFHCFIASQIGTNNLYGFPQRRLKAT